MQGNATIRTLLAILGVVFLLANPAGACAGMMAGQSAAPAHPCCPTPTAGHATAPCICIDRQPAAPSVPAPGEQSELAAVVLAPVTAAEAPVEAVESLVSEDLSPAPHAILLS